MFPIRRSRLRLLLPLVALAGLAGCTPRLLVSVDGYAESASAAKPGKYVLVSGDPRMPETDLQFRANAAQVEKALGAAGWVRVNERKEAATLIRFRWFVGEPTTEIRQYDTPEYGVTGYSVARTRQTDPATGRTTTHASVAPTYGFAGNTRRTDTRITYGMGLVLDAYDIAKETGDGAPAPQLWKTIIATRDTHGDFRRLLPEMLKAAAPHLGADTAGLREIEIKPPEAR